MEEPKYKAGDRFLDVKTARTFRLRDIQVFGRRLLILQDEETGKFEVGRPGNDIVARVVQVPTNGEEQQRVLPPRSRRASQKNLLLKRRSNTMGSRAECVVCHQQWPVPLDFDGQRTVCNNCRERPEVAAIWEAAQQAERNKIVAYFKRFAVYEKGNRRSYDEAPIWAQAMDIIQGREHEQF